MRRRIRETLGVVLLLLGGWVLAAYLLERAGRVAVPEGQYDAIVVPGCMVWSNGEASPALARRTRHAVELYRRGFAPKLILTGGVGSFPPSEAQAARAIALELGVPEEAIILEERSTSTDENARFAADEAGPDMKVLVVTDAFHVVRSKRVFQKWFADADAVGSTGLRSVRVKGALREVPAIVAYALRGQFRLQR